MSIEDRLRSLGSPPRDLPAPSARPTTHPTADPGPGVTTCPRGSPGRCCAARYARRPNATARRPSGQRTNGPDQSRHLRRPQSSGRKKFQKVTRARAGARRPGRARARAGATGPGRVGDRRMSGSRPTERGGVAAGRAQRLPPATADNRHRVLTTDQLTAMDFPSTRPGQHRAHRRNRAPRRDTRRWKAPLSSKLRDCADATAQAVRRSQGVRL